MMQLNKKIYWIFTILVSALLLLPSLAQRGMFLDGVTYAAISRNLASGLGTFFTPYYTKTLYTHFYEHPPLVFGIQSFFFKIFGEYFWVEKLYSLFITIVSAIGIVYLWNIAIENKEHKKNSWFPIFIWITIPTIFWAYSNNILEDTMGVFTLFSVIFITKGMRKREGESIVYLFLGALFIFLAFLSKGLVGIFPLLVPVLYGVSYRENSKKVLKNAVILFILTLIIALLVFFIFPELKSNIVYYFKTQLIPAIEGKREITTNNRFKIILDLIVELLFPILLLLFFYFYNKKKGNLSFKITKASIYYFLIGIFSSLPLIITLKQRKFYLVPSIPFYVLSFSLLLIPFLQPFFKKHIKIFKRINYLLAIVLVFLVTQLKGYSRDEKQIKDIVKISSIIPKGTIISANNLSNKWRAIAYFSRLASISLTEENSHQYLLIEKESNSNQNILKDYEEINLNLSKYNLYKLKQ